MTNVKRKKSRTPRQPTGQWIRSEKRLAIYLHDAAPADITLDHVVPRSRGGSNEASNLFTACRSCNSARGAGPLCPSSASTARR